MTEHPPRPAATAPPPAALAAPAPRARWSPGVELSADPAFAGRIRRLTGTSVVALGLIWLAAAATGTGSPLTHWLLALGWLAMPLLLWLSLRQPRLRYALVLPSLLVGVALLVICLTMPPPGPVAAAGWWLLTGGIWLGGGLGFWFWFRWLPVPAALDAPFAPGRWALIIVHVAAIVGGLLLVTLAAWTAP